MSSPHPSHLPLPEIASTKPSRRGRKIVSRSLYVVTIHIPLRYNANVRGIRKAVEQAKINETLREAQSYFSGFSILGTSGWCRSAQEGGIWDDHLRIEVDIRLRPVVIALFLRWKQMLKKRFAQMEIYMRVTGPARWL